MPLTNPPAHSVISSEVRRAADNDRDVASLRRLARGDRDALADLYDAHAAALYRHGYTLTRSTADAEDLVQATFVRLATTGASLLAVRRPGGYLHRILRTAWIDDRRRPASQVEEQADPLADRQAPGGDGAVDVGLDVAAALAKLPATQREIVQLHLVEGFSFREAGGITGVSMFTAASRYRVALGRLREMLEQR